MLAFIILIAAAICFRYFAKACRPFIKLLFTVVFIIIAVFTLKAAIDDISGGKEAESGISEQANECIYAVNSAAGIALGTENMI